MTQDYKEITQFVNGFIDKYAGTGEWLIPKSARVKLTKDMLSRLEELRTAQLQSLIKEVEGKINTLGDSLSAKSLKEKPLTYHAKKAVKNNMHAYYDILTLLKAKL